MKHTIQISGTAGSVTRDKPPVDGQPLVPGGPTVCILSEKRLSAAETVWLVELRRITSRAKP